MAEVLSPSTAARDRGLKMDTYASHGVGEYWIVDDEARRVEIYRLARTARTYRLVASLGFAETATTPELPGLALGLEDLFASLGRDAPEPQPTPHEPLCRNEKSVTRSSGTWISPAPGSTRSSANPPENTASLDCTVVGPR